MNEELPQVLSRPLAWRAEGTRTRRGRARRFWLGRAFALMMLHCWVAGSLSAEVVLLVERGAYTYGQAAQGFTQALSGAVDVERIELDEGGRLPRERVNRWREHPPQLVIAIGTRAAREANGRLPELPILYCLTLRPVENQLVGSNIGGIVLDADLPQQFEAIRKLLPNIRRLGLVYDEVTSGPVVERARQSLGPRIQILSRNARTPREAERQMQDLFSNVLGPGDAFLLLWDSVVANPANFRILVELSLKNKVPLIVPARPFVEAGALISVGANYEEAGRQLAQMARLILSGKARPGDFQAVRPSQLTVTINGEVARKLGVTIPLDLRADILAPLAETKRR